MFTTSPRLSVNPSEIRFRVRQQAIRANPVTCLTATEASDPRRFLKAEVTSEFELTILLLMFEWLKCVKHWAKVVVAVEDGRTEARKSGRTDATELERESRHPGLGTPAGTPRPGHKVISSTPSWDTCESVNQNHLPQKKTP